jgi:hypothetical protein
MVFAHDERDNSGYPTKTTIYVAVPASGNTNNCGQWLCAPLTTIFLPERISGLGVKGWMDVKVLSNGNLYVVLNKNNPSSGASTVEGYEVGVGTPIKIITQETILQETVTQTHFYRDMIGDPATSYPLLVFVKPDTTTYKHEFIFAQRKSSNTPCPGNNPSWSCTLAGKHQFTSSVYSLPFHVELAIENNQPTVYFLEYNSGYSNTLYKIVNTQVQSTGVKVDTPFLSPGVYKMIDVENSVAHSGILAHTHIVLADYDYDIYPPYNMIKSRMIHCTYITSGTYQCNTVDPYTVANPIAPPILLDLAVL